MLAPFSRYEPIWLISIYFGPKMTLKMSQKFPPTVSLESQLAQIDTDSVKTVTTDKSDIDLDPAKKKTGAMGTEEKRWSHLTHPWQTLVILLTSKTQYRGSSVLPPQNYPSLMWRELKWWWPPPLTLSCQGYQTEQLPTRESHAPRRWGSPLFLFFFLFFFFFFLPDQYRQRTTPSYATRWLSKEEEFLPAASNTSLSILSQIVQRIPCTPLTSFSSSALGITCSVPHALTLSLLLPASLRIAIPSSGIFLVTYANLAILHCATAAYSVSVVSFTSKRSLLSVVVAELRKQPSRKADRSVRPSLIAAVLHFQAARWPCPTKGTKKYTFLGEFRFCGFRQIIRVPTLVSWKLRSVASTSYRSTLLCCTTTA